MEEQHPLLSDPANAEASLQRRLHALQSRCPGSQERFAWLGIAAEEGILAPPMMAIWWQVDEKVAGDHLEQFRDADLLLTAAPCSLDGLNYPGYRLPALCRKMALRLLIGDSPHGLGIPQTEAHRMLLERYREHTADGQGYSGGWAEIREDGYIHEHLTWHMEQADRFDEMLALLQEEAPTGRNAWHRVKERLGQRAGYREDVKRAWRAVQRESRQYQERGEPIPTLGLELRLCLMLTSINSLPIYLPAALIVSLVREEVWRPIAGLNYIRYILEDMQRGDALVALAPYLEESQLEEALTLAQEMDDTSAVIGLTAYLSERQLPKALKTVRNTQEGDYRVEAFAGLLSSPGGAADRDGLLAEALTTVQELEPSRRALALIALASHLPEGAEQARLRSEALSLGWEIENEHVCALIFTSLAPHLTAEQLREALRMVQRIYSETVSAALDSVSEILITLAPSLTEELLLERLAFVRNIKNSLYRSADLGSLIAALARSGRATLALSLIPEIEHDHSRAYAFASLAPYLREDQLQEALAFAREIEHGAARAQALANLLASLTSEEEQTQIIAEIRDALQDPTILDIFSPAWAQAAFARALTAMGRTDQALEIIQKIYGHRNQNQAFLTLVNSLAEVGKIDEALAAARVTWAEEWGREALTDIANHITESEKRRQVLEEALLAAWTIENSASADANSRTKAFTVLAGLVASPTEEKLPPPLPTPPEWWEKYITLPTPDPVLPRTEAQLEEDLSIARSLGDSHQRSRALMDVVKNLAKADKIELALMIAGEVERSIYRGEDLIEIASHLQKVPAQDFYPRWEALLQLGVVHTRHVMQEIIAQMAPALLEHGGTKAIDDVTRALHDVARWWP